MRDFLAWWTADTVQALAAVGSLAVLLAAALFATLFACRQLNVSSAMRRSEYRPYVVVRFRFRGILTGFEVVNVGRVGATDVRLTFDPPPVGDSLTAARRNPLDAMSNLAPGEMRSVWLGSAPSLVAKGKSGEWPMSYSITVEYVPDPAIESDAERHSYTYVLDIAQLEGMSLDAEDPLKKLTEEVGRIAGCLDAESLGMRPARPLLLRSVIRRVRESIRSD